MRPDGDLSRPIGDRSEIEALPQQTRVAAGCVNEPRSANKRALRRTEAEDSAGSGVLLVEDGEVRPRSWSVVTPSSRAVSRRRASVRSRSRWSVRTSTFQGESASHGPGMNSFLPESVRITVMWRFQVAASIEINSSMGRPRFANSSGADQSSDSPTICRFPCAARCR